MEFKQANKEDRSISGLFFQNAAIFFISLLSGL